MKLTQEDVISFIPHREPFLFIDTIEDIIPPAEDEKKIEGTTVLASYFVREDHPIFAGHFPGNPILPGVVQVEMMAQAAIFVLFRVFDRPKDMDIQVALLNVSNAKFRKPVIPGMTLTVESTLKRMRRHILNYDCLIKCENEVMSETSIMASFKAENKNG